MHHRGRNVYVLFTAASQCLKQSLIYGRDSVKSKLEKSDTAEVRLSGHSYLKLTIPAFTQPMPKEHSQAEFDLHMGNWNSIQWGICLLKEKILKTLTLGS